MIKKNISSTIIERYLMGECTLNELKKALKLFSDPLYAYTLKPVLYLYWEKNAINNRKKFSSVENQEKVLEKIHNLINLHLKGVYLN